MSTAPPTPNPAGTALIISEAYVNGGSAGATYTLGYGTSNAPETAVSTAASVTTSLQRQTTGGVVNRDTDNNSVDFTALAAASADVPVTVVKM